MPKADTWSNENEHELFLISIARRGIRTLFHQAQPGDVGNEAAGLAGHDRVGVTHAEPDLLRREPVYVVNLGADRRVAGPDNQKDARLPRLQLLCPSPYRGLVSSTTCIKVQVSGKIEYRSLCAPASQVEKRSR